MDLAVITAKQVLQLLLMILAGAACCKWGVFQAREKSVLANLLLYLVVPAMVLDSYMVEFDHRTVRPGGTQKDFAQCGDLPLHPGSGGRSGDLPGAYSYAGNSHRSGGSHRRYEHAPVHDHHRRNHRVQ